MPSSATASTLSYTNAELQKKIAEYNISPNCKRRIDEAHQQKLFSRIQQTISIIEETLDKYQYLSLSFNGGKDSIVMLCLIHLVYSRRNSSLSEHSWSNNSSSDKKMVIFHILLPNTFKEVDAYVEEIGKLYGFTTHIVDGRCGFKRSLELLVQQFPKIQAVYMGVRKTDPSGALQSHFEKTTPGWPELMRVNPILDWDYEDIWNFILCFGVPYCSLYDLGYTSLGCSNDTQKNPALKVSENEYLPAYMLTDESKERDSRISQAKK